jgi:hypothetical protein
MMEINSDGNARKPMTSFTMRLSTCPVDASDEQLSSYIAPLKQVCSLNHHARKWGALRLAQWANDRSFRTHFVDACGVRVEAPATGIAAFFGELGEAPPALEPTTRYLIEAEGYPLGHRRGGGARE